MSYYTQKELSELGLKSYGINVKISSLASIYNFESIEIGNNSRIDDFCVISGKVIIGNNVHITPMCLLAGGEKGIIINDFVALAYGVKVFSQSDDYSGQSMTNSLIPKQYKMEKKEKVVIGKHVIVGTNSVIFPGIIIEDGCSIGACSLVNKNTLPWGIYVGTPSKRVKDRKKDLLELEKQFILDSI